MYGKLSPSGKKCIFIRYPEHSKGHVFIGEQVDGSVTEIESRDATFLEEDFPGKGEVSKDFQFYELKDLEIDTSNRVIEGYDKFSYPSQTSGSDDVSNKTTRIEENLEEPQLRKSSRGRIPRRHFDIEGEAFMIAPEDGEEPRTVHEAINSLATEVCKNTTDFNFCRDTIYSDPHGPDADRVFLAYILVRKIYRNASDTKTYIESEIKSIEAGRENRDLLKGMKKCVGKYKDVNQTLIGLLSDLDSESYYEFDKRALELDASVRACEKGFNGRSPITRRSNDMIKLANIFYVISLLFPYN
ncbi:hypothetical protein BUALT_Bualt03G0096000 [Buddleja alternifolia]|uniref:Pectinesterase inhibitor domain-containing protein n=1 Tax=Buddleja alternifolia TaxID=168488 RepID=A0AAV6XSD8_9LAMI|nr:hypothetical protein BUALT_Bualt03G0096000 [Buddleja alternifolia]